MGAEIKGWATIAVLGLLAALGPASVRAHVAETGQPWYRCFYVPRPEG